MRRTVLALFAVTVLMAGCERADEAPGTATAPATTARDLTPPEMPADSPPQEEVDPALVAGPTGEPGSCLSEIGPDASARLVQRCIAVSPATRPPCNVANPCAMIQGEIDRSCAMYATGEARPAECDA